MTELDAASRRSSASGSLAPALAVVVAVLGVALLLARTVVVPSTTRPVALLAWLYAAILAGCLLPRVTRGRQLANPWVVGAAGVLAMVAGALLLGAPPAPAVALALPLNVLAALAEEALFRRLLYARMEPAGPAIAIATTAVAFALIHIPMYGAAAFPVDLGAGLLLSWQRWASGSWGAPAATHVAANVMAALR